MRIGKTLIGLGMVLGMTSASWGATASFDPPSAAVTPGTTILTQLELAAGIPDYDFAFVNIGSDDATNITWGGYDTDWTDAFANVSESEDSEEVYPQELVLNADNEDSPITMSSLVVGTLAIDTTGMAIGGPYFVSIDFGRDGSSELADLSEETDHDPIMGTFSFTIVPEPTTLLILSIVTLVARRRR